MNRCADCGGPCVRQATRCHRCESLRKRKDNYACESCGGACPRRAKRCRKCRDQERDRRRAAITRSRQLPGHLCECGCGEPAPIAMYTQSAMGYVKGEPRRFIQGHHHAAVAEKVAQSWRERLGGDHAVDDNGCWIWRRGLTPDGYGRKMVSGHRYPAHRWFYERHRGPIPDGWHVHHLCGVKACVNPDHLKAISPAAHGSARGTPPETIAIILASNAPHRELARQLGISRTTIGRIRKRKP